ncbi:MAG TPA: tetratricopeptide repeat protein [Pyrinomonadaceae bacterium]
MTRTVFAFLAIALCLLLMQAAARTGFSRLLTRYAVAFNSLPAADQAVQLTPSDPEAHRARATVLNRLRRSAEAEASLTTATNLRPGDDLLWLELGSTKEELGDNAGALAAFDQAVRCAPYYAHTHWQRGNLLLRMGRYDEAFADLRQAAVSNKKFLPNLVDLAWGLSGGDLEATRRLIQVNNDNDRLAFLRFLARKGKGADVVEEIGHLKAPLSLENREELVGLLFAARDYYAAFELKKEVSPPADGGVFNGGFEDPLTTNNASFGWIVSSAQAKANLAVDVSEKLTGGKSLRIIFDGEWNPGVPLLSQTIVVEGERGYRLDFSVKTKDLVTGGPPVIYVSDAVTNQLLAKSDPFPQSIDSWQAMHVDFKTLAGTKAIVIRLQGQGCTSDPCPIFGVVWLDDFSLQKL